MNSIYKTVSLSKFGTVLFAVFHLLFFASFLKNEVSTISLLLFSVLVFVIYYPKTRKFISDINFSIAFLFLAISIVIFCFLSGLLPNFQYIIVSCIICFFYFKKLPNTLSLRENYKTKAISISLSWILLCLGFLAKNIDFLSVMPFLLSQFLFVWALTIPFDFADVELDKKNGTINFYDSISSNNALIIVLLLLIFQLIVNMYFFKSNTLFNLVNFIQTIICCYLGFKNIKKYWFGEIVELAFFIQLVAWEILK